MKTNLYIPIEVKNRELHSKIFLGSIAAQKGFNVILGKKNNLNQFILNMPAGFYIGLGAYDNFTSFYRKLKSLGFKIFVNEEEGLVTYTDQMYLDMRISKNCLNFIDEMFTWGENKRELLLTNFPEISNKFVATGNPRFDILQKENHKIYQNEISLISKKYKNFILICSSFGSVNHFEHKDNYMQSLLNKKVLNSEQTIQKYKKYLEVKRKTFISFLNLIPLLSKSFQDFNFVIRPHPSEETKAYKKFSKNFENVFVNSDFSIHPWIINSKGIIHHYCTTSLEALALGKPRFSLRPIRDTICETNLPYECSNEHTNENDLVKSLTKFFSNNVYNDDSDIFYKKKYSKHVLNICDIYSSDYIVERLLKSSHNKNDNDTLKKILYIFKNTYGRTCYLTKKFIRSLNFFKTFNTKYEDHKFKSFKDEEIKNIIQFVRNKYPDLIFKRVANDFINIYKKN